jgi:ubiquitin-conjugating enzyme E2 G1
MVGPSETYYEEGLFKATLAFPSDFPNSPPKMTFVTEILHPNVYESGEVCISILHPAGEDAYNPQELVTERWRPILGVEAVIVSVISMLCDPNIESPANLDAAKLFRDDLPAYKKKCRQCVRKSQEDF